MENIEIQIKTNIPQVTGETTSLRQQVKDLRKEMESTEVGTDAYNQSILKLSSAMHELKDQQELLKNSSGDLDVVFGNLQQVSSGVASGFSAVSAAVTLVGGNSEDLQKTMVKLQTGIALVQGLKGFEGFGKKIKALMTSMKAMVGITNTQSAAMKGLAAANTTTATTTKLVSVAMKGLKAALISTGIGAIVVLVGALVNGLGKLWDWLKTNTARTNEYAGANDKLTASFEVENHALDNEIKLLNASGAATADVIKKKQELIDKQIRETKATIENIKARNRQIEADRNWLQKVFGTGKKEIKENEEEIKNLEETVKNLEQTAEDLNYDYQAEEIKSQKEIQKKREEAAKKAMEDSKKLRDEQIKNAKEVGKALKQELDAIVKKYTESIQSIRSVNSILDLRTINEPLSDVDAWIQVYGTDPEKMKTGLSGVLNSLVDYGISEAEELRDKALAKAKNDDEKSEIIKNFQDSIKEIYSAAYPEALKKAKELAKEYGNPLDTALASGESYASRDSKAISKTFTDRFNSLNHLYKEGIIDYKEYYDTLLNIQDEYNMAVAEFEAQYAKELESSEERASQLRYNYAIKPLEYQKEVGEKFLNELDIQLAEINSKYEDNSAALEADMRTYEGTGQWVETLTQRYKQQKEFIEREKQLEKETTDARKLKITEQLLDNTLTFDQRAELYAQLEQLDRDHLVAQAEFNASSAELDHDFVQNMISTVNQGIDAFNSLGNAMVSLSQANVAEYQRQLEAGELSQEEFDELRKKEAKKQAGIQRAVAIMQTAQGIATVWAQAAQLGPIAGPIVAATQTAAYLVNLAAQLKTINTAEKSALSGGSSSQSPNVSASLLTSDAYQTTLSDDTTANLQSTNRTTNRVYVVESDITAAQDKSKTTVSTATF